MAYPKPITSIDDLPKAYAGLERERAWQQYWMDCGVYRYSPTRPDGTPRTRDEIFSVDTPPPTVSGALHIGHVYSYTQTDFSVRFQRMAGKHVFYPFGFDDNGLPTERLVERVRDVRAHAVSREEFISMCQEVVADAEQQFIDLWQSLALSCDWTQFYTTINERSRAISQASFIDLYNKGYIYPKNAPTQWCWADQTAIAQAEIEDKEVAGHFHDIVFHFDDGSGKLTPVTIATTRPELIPACVAVFAHPDDARYQHLFGKRAITPLFEVEVPILPSTKADPAKGTGILMCCTFGDTEDVEHWQQFNLPTRVVIERSGQLSDFSGNYVAASDSSCELAAERYSEQSQAQLSLHWPSRNAQHAQELARELVGLKIKAARAKIREQLEAAGLLQNVKDITHIVRHSERGGVPIEILVTPQWYIRILEHKQALIEQGRKVRWHPEYMIKRYEHWVEGLNQDWCISRQRYNGVPFPVWYAVFKKHQEPVLADPSQLPTNPLVNWPLPAVQEKIKERQLEEISEDLFEQIRKEVSPECIAILGVERDVMDTWATSSVTPLLNTHLRLGVDDAEVAARHSQIFPYDLRPQAHDIIRTWAFYTITKAYFHFGEIPWKDIVISGHAQDAGGKKISKSKGHVVTPAEMVEKYTADGLRYWSSSCKLGTDTLYDEKLLGEGKRLINKLFNASKFALRHLLDFNPSSVARAALPAKHTADTAVRPTVDDGGHGGPPHGDAAEDTGGDAGSAGSLPASGEDGGHGGPPHSRSYDPQALLDCVTYPTDRWMLRRLQAVERRALEANQKYEFGDARQAAEDFFWADFCDNYLELSKGRLYGEPLALAAHPGSDPAALRLSAQAALFTALSAILRLFAPVLPHIAEECWSWYHAQWYSARSIHEAPWPVASCTVGAEADDAAGQALTEVLASVRKWKSERNVSIKKPVQLLTVYAVSGESLSADAFAPVLGDLLSTCNAHSLSIGDGPAPADAVTAGTAYSVVCELAEDTESS